MERGEPLFAANTTARGRAHPTAATIANIGDISLESDEGRDRGLRPPTGDQSTIMASPTIVEEKKHEQKKYDKFKKYTFTAAAMSSTVEAYATILPVIFQVFFVFTMGHVDEAFASGIPTLRGIIFNLSIFLGIPIGSIIAAHLSRKSNDKNVACGFMFLIFLGVLPTTLADTGLSIPFLPVMISFRAITGIGIGGCRAINALTSVRVATPKWRGLRMTYIGANSAIGYMAAIVSGIGALWIWGGSVSHISATDCDENCRIEMDKCWRLVSGTLMLSILFALTTRIMSSRKSPHPENTSRVILKFSPPFIQFTRNYRRHNRYMYPLVHLCVIALLSSATFYAMLFNLRLILEKIHFAPTVLPESYQSARPLNDNFAEYTVTEYVRRMLLGFLVIVGLGIILGYIILGALVDVWGRKRLLISSHIFLCVLFSVLAGCWELLSMEGSLGLVCIAFLLQVTGPIGIGYVYAAELFPRAYRHWCFLLVDMFGCLGAILGISAGTAVMHSGPVSSHKFGGIRAAWCMFAVCAFCGLVSTMGLVETARKEIGVIEGECYGDWGKWGDRRRMRPEGAGADESEA
ncbi:hypothetical protein Dda_5827 [Drechslerella dactyloides]|uniref:Major facilitator superfamily (MFS) profile domain-containing protein n=1 Tax=Drechslerella dactyloides TaxID=74499 RepID=A0AAD6IV52_DREDA|nr:hypothetical protein Dda_5827 [Drechslerella dactyloides]